MPDWTSLLVERVASAARPVVLIDGRSGSGKTELGSLVAARLGAQLVRLDDLYPGWDGLDAGSRLVVTDLLERARWRRWDWASSGFAESYEIDPTKPLVVEGCGALSRDAKALATLGVWVELDAATRKIRALARDGESFAPHWDAWAAQEQAFIDREHPEQLADLVVDGATIL